MLPTTILVPPIIPVSSVYQSHIVMIALVQARPSPALDELSNIAPRFVELAVTLWAQTHWGDRQAYARKTVKMDQSGEKLFVLKRAPTALPFMTASRAVNIESSTHSDQ